ncbi:MAG: hypothetical protein ACI35O_15895 [Bacillaceae bacterium]
MKFLTLVEIELRKVIPFLLAIFGVGTLACAGFFYKAMGNVNDSLAQQAMQQEMTMEAFLKTAPKISLAQIVDGSMGIFFAFLLMAFAIIGFGFFLWYKEWIGTSKRIYTLLALKGSRLRIFTSKLTVFVLSFIAYYAVVIINLYIGTLLMKGFLPEGAVAENLMKNALTMSELLSIAFPVSLYEFFYKMAFLVMMFSILSVFVLMDRSKRIWGMVAGAVYGALTVAVFIYTKTWFLYTSERVMVDWTFVAIVLVLSMVQVVYLLKKKVSI